MATLNSHGLEPQEEAIMDLWDATCSVDEIATRLAIPLRVVENAVRNFGEGRPDRWAYRARFATARLAQAIASVHPEMMAA